QGEISTHTPRMRLIHSSHSAKAERAAIAKMAMAMALSHAVHAAGISPAKPTIHGDRNNHTARMRLRTSPIAWLFRFIGTSMSEPMSEPKVRFSVARPQLHSARSDAKPRESGADALFT